MFNLFKNTVLLISSVLVGILIFVVGFIYLSHQDITIPNPLLPVTHFSLENAPTESLKGNIASFSGNVAWQSRTAATASLINTPVTIGQGEEIVAQGNGAATIKFPKGILVQMNSNSDIGIVQMLPANIVILQNQGTVSYQNSDNKIPLSINGLDLMVNINQGTAQVSVDKSTSSVVISVSSGSAVATFTDTQNNTQVETINNGNQMTFDNNTKTADIENLK
jgi:hypothetical protein